MEVSVSGALGQIGTKAIKEIQRCQQRERQEMLLTASPFLLQAHRTKHFFILVFIVMFYDTCLSKLREVK